MLSIASLKTVREKQGVLSTGVLFTVNISRELKCVCKRVKVLVILCQGFEFMVFKIINKTFSYIHTFIIYLYINRHICIH